MVAKSPDETVCFVEVKTRSGISAGLPEDAVDAKKQSKYERIAMLYMADKENIDNLCIRFDAIAICASENNHALLRHHKGCFDGRG
ncbi:MAG: YraN family protein [Coriobacteriales bacterium]|nr:YraN family protein [Coriobacteriales bacterium]